MSETLAFAPARLHPELVAPSVSAALEEHDVPQASVLAAPIDPDLSDTAAFCDAYGIDPARTANCVIAVGRRGETTSYAACVVLATTKVDINSRVRKLLDARRASFAPMDDAVALTGMEYGGITPIGVPVDWRVFVDARIPEVSDVIIGSGVRASKIKLDGHVLAGLPGVEVIEDLARPVE